MDAIGMNWTPPTYGFGMTARAMQGMMTASPAWDRVQITPPGPGASDADLADFLNQMRRLKQEALRNAAPARPADPDKGAQNGTGPLSVKAHGFYKGEEFVPVRSIRIFEVNNYRKRSTGQFNGSWYESEYSHRMDNARVGQYYRAVVTWSDGSTQERDVRMDSPAGASVDIWKY